MERGFKVSFLIYGHNAHGALGVVNKAYSGMIPRHEFTERPRIGSTLTAYVQRILYEGKIDCSRHPTGDKARTGHEHTLLEALRAAGGRLPLTDKSPPQVIQDQLGMSKKAFKRVVGGLYRRRLIQLHDDAITLESP